MSQTVWRLPLEDVQSSTKLLHLGPMHNQRGSPHIFEFQLATAHCKVGDMSFAGVKCNIPLALATGHCDTNPSRVCSAVMWLHFGRKATYLMTSPWAQNIGAPALRKHMFHCRKQRFRTCRRPNRATTNKHAHKIPQ